MAISLGANLAKDLDDYYDPQKSLEDYGEEFADPDFNKKTALARARFSRFLATKSFSTLPGVDLEAYSAVEKDEIITKAASKIRDDNPDKYSQAYEAEVTRTKYRGRGPGVKRKETKDRVIGTYFEELSRESLNDMSSEDLDKLPSKTLLQLRDDLNIEDYYPDLYKRMTAVGKARSGDLSEEEAFGLALANGVVPFFSEYTDRTDEERASLYLGYEGFKPTEILGSVAALVGGGWAIQVFRKSLGIASLAKNIALTGGLEGVLGLAYKDVAPGLLAELAGKPDSYILNFMEAAAISSLVDGVSAMRHLAKFAKKHGMTKKEFLSLDKGLEEKYRAIILLETPAGKRVKGGRGQLDDIPPEGDIPPRTEPPAEPLTPEDKIIKPKDDGGVADEIAELEASPNPEDHVAPTGRLIGALPLSWQVPAQSAVKSLNKHLKNWFTKEGQMSDEMFASYRKKISHIAADYKNIQDMREDLLGKMAKLYGNNSPPSHIGKQINEILSVKGVAPETLSALDAEVLVEPVKEMKHLIEDFSIEIGKIEGMDPGLRAIIADNQGFYLYRSFKSYTRPNWEKELKSTDEGRKAIDDARKFLQKENPNISEEEVNYMLDTFIKPKQAKGHDSFYDSFMAMDKHTRNIFKERKNIPEQILKIMGPEDDAIYNFVATAHNQAHFLRTHKMLEEIKANELGKTIFEKKAFKDGKRYDQEIGRGDFDDPYDQLRPLAGMYTSPEMKKLLLTMDQFKLSGHPAWDIYKWTFLGPKAISQLAKTVWNPATHVRNWMGGLIMVAANGNFIRPFRGTVKGGNEGLDHAWDTIWTNLRGVDKGALREVYDKYLRLGIIGTEARSGEILEILGRMTKGKRFIEENLRKTNKINKALKQGKRWTLGAYQAEDDFWKIYNFEGERQAYKEVYGIKENYVKKFPDRKITTEAQMKKELDAVGVESWGDELLDETAAEITRNQIPNYREVSKVVRALRLTPFGNFISFPAEIIRTSGNIMKQGWKEMKNPLTRRIGRRRLASFAAFGLGAGTASAMVTRQLTNTSAVQDHDLRRFMPHWSENSNIQYISNSQDGVIKYLDLSYTDPYDYLKRPFYSIIRNIGETDSDKLDTDIMESFLDGMGEYFEPFVEQSMVTKAVSEALYNKKFMDGKPAGQIYNDADTTGDKLLKAFNYVWENTLEPGVVRGAEKLVLAAQGKKTKGGRPYDFLTELLGFAGLRVSTIDIKEVLVYNGLRNQAGIGNSRKIFTDKARDGSGNVTPEDLIKELYKSETARFNYFQEAYRDMEAAVSNGVSRRKTARIFRDKSNIPKDDVRAIMRGGFRPYTPSKDTYRKMRESGHERSPEELRMIWDGLNMVIKNFRNMPLNPDPDREEFLPDNPY